MKQYIIILIAIALPLICLSQTINNQYTYRSVGLDGFTRLQYENDLFTGTDEFYTQGMNFEYASPSFKKIPLKFLTIHPKDNNLQYGIGVQHNAYTPKSIEATNILYGDRPYAASLMLQYFAIATDMAKKQRISSTLSLGIIGSGASGRWIQATIHSATGDAQPQGWKYQIPNDAVINYRLLYEKGLVQLNKYLLLNATGTIDVGTLLTRATVGANLMVGFFDSPYGSEKKHRFNIYLYTNPEVNAIGYDATLQGGVFNGGSSPYRIPAGDMERLVFNNRYGVVARYGRFYFEYYRYNISREFNTGEVHAWGGFQAGLAF